MASVFDLFGINKLLIRKLNKKNHNNYIRILNYHHVSSQEKENFISQLEWYSEEFEWCDIDDLELFLNGEKQFLTKPGILITFDDGYLDNYYVVHSVLSLKNIRAVYCVSAGLLGEKAIRDGMEEEYMSSVQLTEMASQGAIIACHTFSHHRMESSDTKEVLQHEIVEAKVKLEKELGIQVSVFCWCGGEENTYTKEASDLIKMNYKYGLMSNSAPILKYCNRFQLDRTNIGANWPLSLVRFQLCGIVDKRYQKKRDRVHSLTQ